MKQTLTIMAFGLTMSASGCAYFNEEAGASLDQGEFGNATMNNQLAMTCRKASPSNMSKYGNPISANCPGREQDGKYALFAYAETVESATEVPSGFITNTDTVEE